MKKSIVLCLLTASFALGSVIAASPAQPDKLKKLATSLNWKLSLGADGRVAKLVAKGESIAPLREKLESEIRQWDFEPGQLDGKPAATDTLLIVDVEMTESPDGSEYAVRIKNARTGGSVADATAAPRISKNVMNSLMRNSGFAMVVAEVRYDAAGKAISIDPAKSSAVQDGPMLESVRKAVKQWTFQPELIAGIGVPGTVFVPVCFAVASDMAKARQDSRRCRWTQPGTQVSVGEGESLALDSSVKMKTDISKSVL